MRSRLAYLCTVISAVALGTVALPSSSARAEAAGDNCAPARMMIVLDRSSSMQTGTIAGDTKWSIATGAINQVVSAFDDSIKMGLNVFPAPNQCSPGVVRVTPALGSSAAILAELQDPPPKAGNWTPMAQTLQAVAAEPSMTAPGTPAYAVLVTDGWQWCDPYDATTRFDPVDAIASLSAAGITTYVVGFGGAVDALALNSMAVEAGTARPGCDPSGATPGLPGACYFSASSPDQLVTALTDIAVSVSTEICDGLDNDCDGLIDEDLDRACSSACGGGTETCVAGAWQGCDAPAVEAEVCDGLDNNCDGSTDPGCDCAAGESRGCGGADACQPGTQSCAADGTWGECEGARYPESESCDALDNDCDGRVDEMDDDVGSLCGPGFTCSPTGTCDELPPQDPIGDDEPDDDQDGFGAEGTAAGGCCDAGTGRGSAGHLALLLVVLGIMLSRRRFRASSSAPIM